LDLIYFGIHASKKEGVSHRRDSLLRQGHTDRRKSKTTLRDPIDREKKKQKDTVDLVPRVGVAAAVCPPLVRLRSCLDWIRSISKASSRSDRCKNKTKKNCERLPRLTTEMVYALASLSICACSSR
jgi:hypothetical protein